MKALIRFNLLHSLEKNEVHCAVRVSNIFNSIIIKSQNSEVMYQVFQFLFVIILCFTFLLKICLKNKTIHTV